LKYFVYEMRPKDWLKNVFVFVPIVFSLELRNTEKLLAALIAFTAFCLASSAIYVLNDIYDADKDAAHPVKRKRPVASGALTKSAAAVFAVFLAVISLAAGFFADWTVCAVILLYLAVNLSYTLLLKHKPIFDCFCIAAGFVFRVYAGSYACGEPVSDWLFLTIVTMALFMGFGKRRGELAEVDGKSARPVLKHYSLNFLEGMVFLCAGLSVAFYALWAMYRGSAMIFTVPLIIFIVAKYLSLIYNSSSDSGLRGDPTSVIYSSKTLIAACGAYAVLTVALLYAFNN